MSNDVWYAALLSIPISIGTGLLVNPIRRWYEENSKSRDVKKAAREQEQYTKTLMFMIRPESRDLVRTGKHPLLLR